jgi:multiple antibiotic resistance protein
VFPLAVPLMAGPGAITSVILHMGAHAGSWPAQLAVLTALTTSLLMVAISLFLASRLERFLGATLISVFSRLLGLLLAALAVQFIIDGTKRAFGL